MSQNRKKALLVSLPEFHFDCLRRMVGESLLKNPRSHTSAATIAQRIICDYLDRLNDEQTGVATTNPECDNEGK